MGRIYAKMIYKNRMTLEEVPARWTQATIDAYWDLYGIHIGEEK